MRKESLLVLVLLLLCGLAFPGYSWMKVAEAQAKTPITFIDSMGHQVEVLCPVEKVVCITSGIVEVIGALDAEDLLIGRDAKALFPHQVKTAPVMAENSAKPNMELIVASGPDVVLADSMFKDTMREKLEAAGIPCLVYTTSETIALPGMITDLGKLLGKEERATQLNDFQEKYYHLVEERTAHLHEKDKPTVFYEWSRAYFSANSSSSAHQRITLAGGINIAANEPATSPTLAPEWVAEKDPEVIVRTGRRGDSFEQLEELYEEVVNRPGLKHTQAVRDGRVHLLKWDISTGLRTVIGVLYFGKWFHPELFQDIDPEVVHKELLDEFYDVELEDVYVYP